jgi:excisionase family DNA binding protein
VEETPGTGGDQRGASETLADVIRHEIRDAVREVVADVLDELLDHDRPVVYTASEVAELLGVGRGTVDALVRSGRLWTVPLGPSRTVRIPAVAVEALCTREAVTD